MIELIRQAVLKVDGVEQCYIAYNDTLKTVNGLPPAAIAVFVKGGKKKQIARAIIDNKCIGVATVGNVSTEARYPDFKWPVNFSYIK